MRKEKRKLWANTISGKISKRKSDKKWYDNNLDMVILLSAKKRATCNNLEFNLERKDVVISKFCPVLGIELKVGKGKIEDFSPTLDRIDNTKGYVKGNIQVISYLANRMKSNANKEQLLAFANWIFNNYGN